MKCLLADIGGTNTRCTVTDADWRPGDTCAFVNRNYDSLAMLLGDFIAKLEPEARPSTEEGLLRAILDRFGRQGALR